MNTNTHKHIARYLIQYAFQDAPALHRYAFLIGCIEPDKNPATYLKGSIRSLWLRGHNWDNAKKYIHCLAAKLEQKDNYTILDFYALGKLMHYVADAFTYAHNRYFTGNLSIHREYEKRLERHIMLHKNDSQSIIQGHNLADIIAKCRKSYSAMDPGIATDAMHIKLACTSVLMHLSEKDIFSVSNI